MNRTARRRSPRLILAGVVLALACAAQAEPITVVVSGKEPRGMDCYRIESVYYMDVVQAGSLYRAQVYWRPLSGVVTMSLHGRQVRFSVNSDKAVMGDKTLTLSAPVILRADRAFVPMDFFASDEFAYFSGFVSRFHPDARLLNVERKVTVGPLRWFSYPGHTRVTLAVQPGIGYSIARRGRSGIEVRVPYGRADSSARVFVEDGVVRALRLEQQPEEGSRLARLRVELGEGVALWKSSEEGSPRRVVLDVFKDKKALDAFLQAPAASAPVPGPASKPPAPLERKKYRIVIDAGHGGKDQGTAGRHGTLEKDVNLRAALELAKEIEDGGDFDLLLTRRGDAFVPLSRRSRQANEFKADLFVSLHCNAAKTRSEKGFEIYFLSDKASDPESQRVADVENAVLAMEGKSAEQEAAASLLQELAKSEFMNDGSELAGLMAQELPKRMDIYNRGVKQAAFYVLRGTHAPAVLVEMGFLSNPGDETRLAAQGFRRRLVQGIYAGILDFAKRRHWDLERADAAH